jgi:ribosomal-protein-alanine N-acetyltransferase
MLSQPQLETERLSLRPLTFADASWIQKVASVRQIADTMISIPHPYPDGEAERYISKQISEFERRSFCHVCDRAEARKIV